MAIQTVYKPPAAACDGIVTATAIGVVACTLADMTHEVIGHLATAGIIGIRVLSLSTVAIQTAEPSRLVSAAGTTANLVVGTLALLLFDRNRARTNWAYFLWLFSAFNLLNSGYIVASALFQNGDWAVVINGLNPAWTWRCLLGIVGATLYLGSIRWLALSMTRFLERNNVPLADVRRVIVAAYFAGGAILTVASFFNPISPTLILISGIGASFGLSAGLLFIPEIVGKRIAKPLVNLHSTTTLDVAWVGIAIVVGIGFVTVFGPGIHFAA